MSMFLFYIGDCKYKDCIHYKECTKNERDKNSFCPSIMNRRGVIDCISYKQSNRSK